jgi:tetratricopeptide (TPR) repeat protein
MTYYTALTTALETAPGPAIARADAAQRAFRDIDCGHTLQGLFVLESSPDMLALPAGRSYRAYCIARERGQFREALRLCQSAIEAEPHNPAHYLNLGRVYLHAGDKARAIAAFWKGISKAPGTEPGAAAAEAAAGCGREGALILQELRRLGIRKKAPFPRLRRGHPLNRLTGRLLAALGLR